MEEIKLHKEQLLSTPCYLKYGHPLNIAELSCTHRKTIRNIISFVDYDIHAFLNLMIMESEGLVVAWTPWGGC